MLASQARDGSPILLSRTYITLQILVTGQARYAGSIPATRIFYLKNSSQPEGNPAGFGSSNFDAPAKYGIDR